MIGETSGAAAILGAIIGLAKQKKKGSRGPQVEAGMEPGEARVRATLWHAGTAIATADVEVRARPPGGGSRQSDGFSGIEGVPQASDR